jgi:hypothetical protein
VDFNAGEYIPAVITGLSPVLVVLFTWITRRGLDRKATEAKAQADRLAQQREDFSAIVGPLQASVETLQKQNMSMRDRMDTMEDKADKAERNTRTVARALRGTLDYYHNKYGDTGPELDRRVLELLEAET